MLRTTRFLIVVVPFLVLAARLLLPAPARSLPLFARQYSMPCTQCHVAFPRLNAFGMKFRQNGYRLEGADGQSPWESQNFPLSLVGNVGIDVASTATDTGGTSRVRTNESEFKQNAVEFHTAGTLAKKVTFHFDNGFATDTGLLESGMAFVQFDDLSKDGALNLKAGIYDAEIPYLTSARRTTLADYMAPVTLDGAGIELNGARQGWTYALGLINSGRTHGKPGDRTLNHLENPYLWVMRDIGGSEVTARVVLDRQDPRKADASASQHVQAELSALINQGRLLVIPGYTYEKFADPDATTPDKVHRGLLEALAPLDKDGKCVLTGRYEITHTPKTDLIAESDEWLGVLDLGYYVNPNAKVGFDWAHLANNFRDPFVDEIQAYVHVGY